jgi:hypothetical protein
MPRTGVKVGKSPKGAGCYRERSMDGIKLDARPCKSTYVFRVNLSIAMQLCLEMRLCDNKALTVLEIWMLLREV